MAAGLTLARAQLDHFARAFDAEVLRWMAGVPAADEVQTDGELSAAGDRSETAQALRAGGPGARPSPSRASTACSASAARA